MFQHEMMHEKSLKTEMKHSEPVQAPLSLGNQDLLGNSHQEASSGFQTAEAPSLSAFDAVSGQTLTPLSTGAAPASFSGPVQAKKSGGGHKRPKKEKAEKTREGWTLDNFSERMDKIDQIDDMLRELSVLAGVPYQKIRLPYGIW